MATASGRFFVYTGFASDAIGGVLLAADTAQRIDEIRNSKASEDEKIDAISRLIGNLLLVGGLIVFGAKDLGKARTRIAGVLGEERAATLSADVLYGLHTLDDSALQALKRVPADEFDAVAKALGRDPKRSAALAKAYGEKFVDEVRTDPARSLDEIGDMLGARAAGATGAGVVGGVRGPDVYQVDVDKGIGRNGTKFERSINTTRNAARAHGATIDAKTIVRDKTTGTVTLEVQIPQPAGTPIEVAVSVEVKAGSALAGGAHAGTGGAGPGRIVQLTPPSTASAKWTARVELDSALLPENVPFVLGHELDEITEFIKRKGAGGLGTLAAETEASLFVTWAKRGVGAPPVTAHDRAAAREFLAVGADVRAIETDLAKATKKGAAADVARLDAQLKNRRETFERLRLNMGLVDPEHLELKLATLRETLEGMGADKGRLTIKAPGADNTPFDEIVLGSQRAATQTEFLALTAGGAKTALTHDTIAHILRPTPNPRSVFLSSGISGGHLDENLKAFLDANPQFAVVLQSQVSVGGVTYRHYKQYRWNGAGAPPRPGDAAYPTPGGPIDASWEVAAYPKTTFDDAGAYLSNASAQFDAWRATLSPADLAKPMRGPRIIGTSPKLGVHFDFTPPDVWKVHTVFIDETWIDAAAKAAATPTPVPTGGPP